MERRDVQNYSDVYKAAIAKMQYFIAHAESIGTFSAHPHLALLDPDACATRARRAHWNWLADRLCSSVAIAIALMSSRRRQPGRTRRLFSAAFLFRPGRHFPRMQNPSISGMSRMLHRGCMQLLQRNARHRFGVMLDAQELVHLGGVTNIIHSIRISQ